MAYNFKNALVNLNEEIRKTGGGASEIPAIKLDVSQLKVSMVAVKSSVASVSAEVEQIKNTLMALSSAETKIGTYNGVDYFRKTYHNTTGVTLAANAKETIDADIDSYITAEGSFVLGGQTGQFTGGSDNLSIWADSTNHLYIWNSGNASRTITAYDLIVTYTKPVNTRQGGKK